MNDGHFHHVVFARSGGTNGYRYLYIDGQRPGPTRSREPGSAATTNHSALFIGCSGRHEYHFAGLVDDVRIFNRASLGAEVKALYTGPGPVLVLPFEAQWAADGSTVADTSGWQDDGTLQTGEGKDLGKSVTGQAGGYALQFDGVNDSVTVPHNAAFDGIEEQDKVTIAAWVYPHAWYNGWFSVVDKYEASGDFGWGFQINNPNGLYLWASGSVLRDVPVHTIAGSVDARGSHLRSERRQGPLLCQWDAAVCGRLHGRYYGHGGGAAVCRVQSIGR